MAEEGSKQVEVCGLDDKHEITALLIAMFSGQLLSTQFLYAGKTPGFTLTRAFLVAGISIMVQLIGVLKIQSYTLKKKLLFHASLLLENASQFFMLLQLTGLPLWRNY